LLGALLLLGTMTEPARAAIIVYDNDLDFSDTNNPSGPWSYQQGNALVAHHTPVPLPQLVPAAANGYWGASSSSLSTSILVTTANGNATGFFSNSDFLAGDMLLRTTDPNSGGPVVLGWTAPTAGTFTYNGFVWFAGTPTGPAFTDFTLALTAGPTLESGTILPSNNRTNFVGFVNGATAVSVNAGDLLALTMAPSIGQPSGTLTGVLLTIDFTPVPEPGSMVLVAPGVAVLAAYVLRRRRKIPGKTAL
jgi:hypothetical protein